MEKIDKFNPITLEDKDYWATIVKQECYDYLKQYSVKIPKETSNKFLQLLCLRIYQNKFVSKEVISTFVRYYNKNASVDQQSRHLGTQDFFYVLNANEKVISTGMTVPIGYHILITLEQPHPKHILYSHKRAGRHKAENFQQIKQVYNNRCITCGSIEEKPHFHNPSIKTVLQQGHMDPMQKLTIENTIPQCQLCNQIYKNYFVFDEKGRTIAVASIEPIKKSHQNVKDEILHFLLEEQKVKGK